MNHQMKELNHVRTRNTKRNAVNHTTILKLNNDCMEHIFSFLPITERIRIQRVCKQWKEVSNAPWHDMKILRFESSYWASHKKLISITIPNLKTVLLHCGSYLTEIDFITCNDLHFIGSKSLFALIKKYCPNVQSMDLRQFRITQKGMEYLANNYSNIIDISIGECWENCEDALSLFFLRNKKLSSLMLQNWQYNNYVTGECLINLSAESIERVIIRESKPIQHDTLCQALRRLNKLHTLIIMENADLTIHINDILNALPAVSNLNLLKIVCCRTNVGDSLKKLNTNKLSFLQKLEFSGDFVNNNILKTISKNCTELSHFRIANSDGVTDSGIFYISCMPKLEHLQLCELHLITGQTFSYMSNLKSLKCISCVDLKNDSFFSLMQSCKSLEILEVYECGRVCINSLIDDAREAVKYRLSNVILQLYIEEKQNVKKIIKDSPLLHIIEENKYTFYYV